MFMHGHTCLGHPVAAAAALAVQRVIARDDLLADVRARGADLARPSPTAAKGVKPTGS